MAGKSEVRKRPEVVLNRNSSGYRALPDPPEPVAPSLRDDSIALSKSVDCVQDSESSGEGLNDKALKRRKKRRSQDDEQKEEPENKAEELKDTHRKKARGKSLTETRTKVKTAEASQLFPVMVITEPKDQKTDTEPFGKRLHPSMRKARSKSWDVTTKKVGRLKYCPLNPFRAQTPLHKLPRNCLYILVLLILFIVIEMC